ncbi:AraC family transcriptional regulator [Pararhizobium gei]|uniref:AraC family transcriptional regulator n=1 Tax=Pararhizobium gei TaxID=1395951 RepID=UPI0023DC21D7|nr:AraC family transcriptional regulator [Rhizobium gei]
MTQASLLQKAEFIDLLACLTHADGDFDTTAPGLTLHRRSRRGTKICGSYKPGFALIVQGAKQVMLGDEIYRYGPGDYLLTSIDLPVATQIVEASPEMPYLSMTVQIDTAGIAGLMAVTDGQNAPLPAALRGMAVSALTPELEDAALRLLRLVSRPTDIPALAPLIEQEILYRLLTGPQGGRLRQLAVTDSQSHQINRACLWLKEHYTLPLKIEELASRVSMSVSSLHHHFKAITAMSPMQYQKQLRLQEARRLMLEEMLDAGSAGHQVGYESQSQFSREYARQYGEPPLRDVGRIRRSLMDGLSNNAGLVSEG